MTDLSETVENRVIGFVATEAANRPWLSRAWLFGSRARGDGRPRSDFDIALEADGGSPAERAAFSLRLREEAPTLCEVDVVWLAPSTPSELRERIDAEGIVLYRRIASTAGPNG